MYVFTFCKHTEISTLIKKYGRNEFLFISGGTNSHEDNRMEKVIFMLYPLRCLLFNVEASNLEMEDKVEVKIQIQKKVIASYFYSTL